MNKLTQTKPKTITMKKFLPVLIVMFLFSYSLSGSNIEIKKTRWHGYDLQPGDILLTVFSSNNFVSELVDLTGAPYHASIYVGTLNNQPIAIEASDGKAATVVELNKYLREKTFYGAVRPVVAKPTAGNDVAQFLHDQYSGKF